jgi:NAD(P)-dependent dehydrogenase (short-subunit alcohol dehydrogenase family)
VSRKDQIDRVVAQVVRRFKRLDILVNLASIYEKGDWAAHLKANAESAYLLSQAAGTAMKKNRFGRIVHISDWTAASGRPRYKEFAPYYVSKLAIKGIVETMALELAPHVLVNAIAPGPILPPKGITKKEFAAVISATPLGRWGGAEAIARTVQFLCETDFVTGETIRVDGGRHLL